MADEIIEQRIEERAQEMLNDLLSNVDLNSILKITDRGLVYIGNEKADDLTLANLKAEAEFLAESNLWRLLYETPKELAQRAMFVNGESLDDMKKGRSILYTLATQKKIIDTLRSYNPK